MESNYQDNLGLPLTKYASVYTKKSVVKNNFCKYSGIFELDLWHAYLMPATGLSGMLVVQRVGNSVTVTGSIHGWSQSNFTFITGGC